MDWHKRLGRRLRGMDANETTPFPVSPHVMPIPELDVDTPMAVQIIDATIASIKDGRKVVAVHEFYDALLDIRSAITNSQVPAA